MSAGKQRIMVICSQVGLTAAIAARLAQLDDVEVVTQSAQLEPVSLKVDQTAIIDEGFRPDPPWRQANLRAMEGAPFITTTCFQGKQTAQWKRETRSKK